MDSCRVCMARNMKMSHIFDTDCSTVGKIEYCTGIVFKQEQGMPSKICDQCLTDLSVAHKFKNNCINSDLTFRKLLLECKIKEEKLEAHIANDDDFHNDEVSDGLKEIKNELDDSTIYTNGDSANCEIELELTPGINTRKLRGPRGPYKKNGKPRQLKKLKFRRLYCEPCGRKFKSKQDLEDHKKDLHKAIESWICEVCGKSFTHQASLYSHVRSHLPPKYECEQCDYKTWHKHDLVKHIRIHTGVKLYQCEFCTASYHTSSNLSCHKRRFHDGVKRFQCQMCDMKFYDKTKLNRHIDSHNDVKRFECHVCHSCFTRRCYWKKHLTRQHNIEIPKQRPGRQKINFLIGYDLVNPKEVVSET